MMSQLRSEADPEKRKSNEEFIKTVIESGVNVNVTEWSWYKVYEHDDYDDETDFD